MFPFLKKNESLLAMMIWLFLILRTCKTRCARRFWVEKQQAKAYFTPKVNPQKTS
jgi:hypothetical protein